jgi:hypothetical protein
MTSNLPIYLILGHGTEKVIDPNEREKLPEGYTLVTYSEAGNASFMEEVCKTLHLFKNLENRELLANPVENRKALEEELNHSVRIYKQGYGIPELNVSPLTYWDFYNNNIHYYQFNISGIYQFPLAKETAFDSPFYNISTDNQEKLMTNEMIRKILGQCPENIVYMNWKDFKGPVIHKLYENALYPPEDELDKMAIFNPSPLALGNKFKISLKSLMEKLGPGIYYYIICRADNEFYGKHSAVIQSFFSSSKIRSDFEDYENYFKGEEGQERLKAVKDFENAMDDAEKSIQNPNTIVKLKRFIRFLQDYPKNVPEYESLPKEYKAFIQENQIIPGLEPFIEYIKKIERVRRLSSYQQNKTLTRRGGGKKKQTRKVKRSN